MIKKTLKFVPNYHKSKKLTIERHSENCIKIEEAFKKLTNIKGPDGFKPEYIKNGNYTGTTFLISPLAIM